MTRVGLARDERVDFADFLAGLTPGAVGHARRCARAGRCATSPPTA